MPNSTIKLVWLDKNILCDEVSGDTYDFRWNKRRRLSRTGTIFNLVKEDDLWYDYHNKIAYKMLSKVPDHIQEAYQLGILMGDVTDENIL